MKRSNIIMGSGKKYELNAVVVLVGVVLGLIVTAAMASAQPSGKHKWGQQVFKSDSAEAVSRSSLNQNVSVEELCPDTPDFSFTVPDPSDDAFFGFGIGPVLHDITSVSGEGDANTLCLTVEFAGPVDPADAETGQEVAGYIEFDIDEDPSTGFSGNADFFCPDRTGIGVDVFLDMFTVLGGSASLFSSDFVIVAEVPVVFDENSFTAVIPLSALGGDNLFNFAMVLGTIPEPTDCAPNGGSIHSPDGSIVPVLTIGSISGRVIDAETGEPLRGDVPPFASVELRHCFDSECFDFEFVNSQSTDSEGRFLFNTDFLGRPLVVGTYQVAAFADQYQQSQTAPFNVAEGEDKDIGDIPLMPSFLQVLEVMPCNDLSPLGGVCEYSFRVRNNSSTSLKGAVWSLVDGFGIGSFIDFTVFQTGIRGAKEPTPQPVSIGSGESKTLRFKFRVPGTVANGATICTQAFVGQSPTPSFNTLVQRFLFCISKGTTGFVTIPETKARPMLQQLRWTR